MTTFREFVSDLIREYFAVPRSSHETQVAAATWQPTREPVLPANLAKLPNYRPGQYARHYSRQLTTAIKAAITPDLSRLPTLKPTPQATTPLPAREIVYANTPHDVSNAPTALLDDDNAITEKRPAIRLVSKETHKIPAMKAEVGLLELMRGPVHEQSTGENERLPAEAWML